MNPCLIELSDDRLTTLIRAGEDRAWEELIRRYYLPLLRYLTAQTGNSEDAAELVQETFLTAWRRFDRLAPSRSFAPWLYRIARYTFLPWQRRRSLCQQVSLEASAPHVEAHLSLTPRGSDSFSAAIERDPIQSTLNEMSPSLREALLLHELMGLTTREIAAALDISVAAAEQRVARAARDFRHRYNEVLTKTSRVCHNGQTTTDCAASRTTEIGRQM